MTLWFQCWSIFDLNSFTSFASTAPSKDGDGNSSHGWSNIFVTPDLFTYTNYEGLEGV